MVARDALGVLPHHDEDGGSAPPIFVILRARAAGVAKDAGCLTPPREILTVAEMGAGDRAAIAAGTPGPVLMEHAGAAVTHAVAARFPPCRTLVLAGPGNNGGDAYAGRPKLLKARG